MVMFVTAVTSEVSKISDLRVNWVSRKVVIFYSNPNSATTSTVLLNNLLKFSETQLLKCKIMWYLPSSIVKKVVYYI